MMVTRNHFKTHPNNYVALSDDLQFSWYCRIWYPNEDSIFYYGVKRPYLISPTPSGLYLLCRRLDEKRMNVKYCNLKFTTNFNQLLYYFIVNSQSRPTVLVKASDLASECTFEELFIEVNYCNRRLATWINERTHQGIFISKGFWRANNYNFKVNQPFGSTRITIHLCCLTIVHATWTLKPPINKFVGY